MDDEQQPSGKPERDAPAEPEAVSAPAQAPEPTKKKRKKKAAEDAEAEAAAREPRVVEIGRAFDAGDFARVRVLGAALAKESDPALAAVGTDYLARIGVDGIQIAFLGLCAVAILAIAMHYIGH